MNYYSLALDKNKFEMDFMQLIWKVKPDSYKDWYLFLKQNYDQQIRDHVDSITKHSPQMNKNCQEIYKQIYEIVGYSCFMNFKREHRAYKFLLFKFRGCKVGKANSTSDRFHGIDLFMSWNGNVFPVQVKRYGDDSNLDKSIMSAARLKTDLLLVSVTRERIWCEWVKPISQ